MGENILWGNIFLGTSRRLFKLASKNRDFQVIIAKVFGSLCIGMFSGVFLGVWGGGSFFDKILMNLFTNLLHM